MMNRHSSECSRSIGSRYLPQQRSDNMRLYSSSYFLPGVVAGRSIMLLIDTGCSTNILAKHVFDRLPAGTRNKLQPSIAENAKIADGSDMPLHGTITLPCTIRDHRTVVAFRVAAVFEDAILGMPFLVDRACSIEFGSPAILLDGKMVPCVDKHGRVPEYSCRRETSSMCHQIRQVESHELDSSFTVEPLQL